MATFSRSTFSHASYAALRPSYPPSLYKRVLDFHIGPRNLLVDLGTGHGVVARALAPSFQRVFGTDPSSGMISQARSLTPSDQYSDVKYHTAAAEYLPMVRDGEADCIVAGQAAHWFDYGKFWPEMRRILRKRGTVAFWGYKDPVFVDHPKASRILFHYAYDDREDRMGPYWQQPGRSIVQDQLRKVVPPYENWEEVTRVEYEPGVEGKRSGEGTPFLEKTVRLGEMLEYLRTWSSYHAWKEAHPEEQRRADGGSGDVIDRMFDEMKTSEAWDDSDLEVNIEWGTSLVMARKKH
ncbi:MAG: hypothetical protein M1820_002865 [Bogoriella megaspora]|nr:MAG: hypothetical protein M1820_002865 [Bogoriella megaspora]